MLNKILTVSTLIFCLGVFNARAQINQDVYIDYSVLDDLAGTDNPKVHNQPLFPEVKKSSAPAVKKKAKAVAAAKKTTVKKAAAVKTEAKQEEVKIKVLEKKSEAPAVKSVKEVPDEAVKSLEPESMSIKPIAPVEEISDNATTGANDGADEPKPTPVQPAMIMEQNTSAGNLTAAGEDVVAEKRPQGDRQSMPERKDIRNSAAVTDDNKIFFEEDATVLSEGNKRKIDLILKKFEAPSENKVAINSYNFDDGSDVFKKKRQSLDRAIAVRSYLLQKNYKNFSIKVVNVTDDASKKNLVEIEEIK